LSERRGSVPAHPPDLDECIYHRMDYRSHISRVFQHHINLSSSKIQSCTARLPGLGESPIQIEFAPGLKPLAFVGRATRQLSPDRGDNGGKLKKDIYRLHRKLPTFSGCRGKFRFHQNKQQGGGNLHFVLLHQTIYRHNLTFVTCADSNASPNLNRSSARNSKITRSN
jgi:hypothetical protein